MERSFTGHGSIRRRQVRRDEAVHAPSGAGSEVPGSGDRAVCAADGSGDSEPGEADAWASVAGASRDGGPAVQARQLLARTRGGPGRGSTGGAGAGGGGTIEDRSRGGDEAGNDGDASGGELPAGDGVTSAERGIEVYQGRTRGGAEPARTEGSGGESGEGFGGGEQPLRGCGSDAQIPERGGPRADGAGAGPEALPGSSRTGEPETRDAGSSRGADGAADHPGVAESGRGKGRRIGPGRRTEALHDAVHGMPRPGDGRFQIGFR